MIILICFFQIDRKKSWSRVFLEIVEASEVLKDDKKRSEYDLTYEPSKKNSKYDKAEDANGFKFDYKKKAKQEKDTTIFTKAYYISVQFSNKLLASLNYLFLISTVSLALIFLFFFKGET